MQIISARWYNFLDTFCYNSIQFLSNKVGELLQFKNLSRLLGKIASGGADTFYSGNNLKEMLEIVNSNGGNITENDFRNYEALKEGVHHILFGGDYITLHITLLYIILYYITLNYVTLQYITLYHNSLHWIALHNTTLLYVTIHNSILHYISLHNMALHYILSHFITFTLYYIKLQDITFYCIT